MLGTRWDDVQACRVNQDHRARWSSYHVLFSFYVCDPCVVSGEPATEPVISSTGHVFEKRLLEQYVSARGTCPVTGQPLRSDGSDWTRVATQSVGAAIPRVNSTTSIPQLLGGLQTEYDSMMLENFSLRHKLEEVRQELSVSLYRFDAACRVIARLKRERDDVVLRGVGEIREKRALGEGEGGHTVDQGVNESGAGGRAAASQQQGSSVWKQVADVVSAVQGEVLSQRMKYWKAFYKGKERLGVDNISKVQKVDDWVQSASYGKVTCCAEGDKVRLVDHLTACWSDHGAHYRNGRDGGTARSV